MGARSTVSRDSTRRTGGAGGGAPSDGGGGYAGPVSEQIGSFADPDPNLLITVIAASGGPGGALGPSTQPNGFRKIIRGIVGGSDPFAITGDFMTGTDAISAINWDGGETPEWVELVWQAADSTWHVGAFAGVTFTP